MSIPSNSKLIRLSVICVLLLGASGCGEEAERPALWHSDPMLDDAKLARRTFTLGGTSFAIVLPEAAVVQPEFANKVYIDLTRGRRLQRLLILSTVHIEGGAKHDQRDVLANGARLEYHVDNDTGGGSGGPIAQLTGRMELGAHVLWVDCTDQSTSSRYPGWCVPYLARLMIAERIP